MTAFATDKKTDPTTRSSVFAENADHWQMVSDLLDGAKAMRDKSTIYLPKLPGEPQDRYDFRLSHTKLTNVFSDIVENLAARPFSVEVTVNEEAPEEITNFLEDVDGGGSTIHQFGGEMMHSGIAYGVHGVLVDYTNAPVKPGDRPRTIADEERLGVRPFWRHYPALSVIEAESDVINGQREFVSVRLAESKVVKEGYSETTRRRVRILKRDNLEMDTAKPARYGPPYWKLLEERREKERSDKLVWVEIGTGRISIGKIPFVLYFTGRKKSGNSLSFRPPMKAAADLQLAVYRDESALDNVKARIAFPMLAADETTPDVDDNGNPKAIDVGPGCVLYSPTGKWKILESSAQTMTFLKEDIKETLKELRELGRQPLTAQSGNLTVITTAFAASKGNSAILAWAINEKSALEECITFTGDWLKIDASKVEVKMNLDFDTSYGGDDSFGHVLEMALGDKPLISRNAALTEAKRRNILDSDYDADEDEEQIGKEEEDREGEDDDIITPPPGAQDVPPKDQGDE